MVATKFFIMAMAAYVKATPVVSAPKAATTQWTPLSIEDTIDWDGFDKEALKNQTNWNNTDTSYTKTSKPSDEAFTIMSGACNQGTCPDYTAGFDLVYSFIAIIPPAVPDPSNPGNVPPPSPIFSSSSDIRVNDCNQCYRQKVGSSIGGNVPGGCWDFNACGREQTICVDPGNYRAHRVWKGYVKTCYHMKVEPLGGCGPIQSRIVLHPDGEVPCNW